jgi:hypothetical protein
MRAEGPFFEGAAQKKAGAVCAAPENLPKEEDEGLGPCGPAFAIEACKTDANWVSHKNQ